MLRICQHNNTLIRQDGSLVQFSRRWEAMVLALLVTTSRANQVLSKSALQAELQKHGQESPLNRSQLCRLIDSLTDALDTLPRRPVQLFYGARKKTVGPWELRVAHGLDIALETSQAYLAGPATDLQPEKAEWRWARLLDNGNLQQLRKLLGILQTSDAYGAHGENLNALHTIAAAYALPLSSDTRQMLWLREAHYHNRQGNHAAARTHAQAVLDDLHTVRRDASLAPHARFMLDRIDYDESPGTVHHRLWFNGGDLAPIHTVQYHSSPDWHNLRALLARRQLRDCPDPAGRTRLHDSALCHYESAIYGALRNANWERLHAYVANLAFHLQAIIEYGLASIPEVFNWHALSMNYVEEFGVGKDAAWTDIFLGEFWLEHADTLERLEDDYQGHRLEGPAFENLHPSDEKFYLRAIERVKHNADERQVAIAWILYIRFLDRAGQPRALRMARLELEMLLVQSGTLRGKLVGDGYGEWVSG